MKESGVDKSEIREYINGKLSEKFQQAKGHEASNEKSEAIEAYYTSLTFIKITLESSII